MRLILALILAVLPLTATAQQQTSAGPVTIQPVMSGLGAPWGFSFLPGGGFLVTERDGELYLVQNNRAREVSDAEPRNA